MSALSWLTPDVAFGAAIIVAAVVAYLKRGKL